MARRFSFLLLAPILLTPQVAEAAADEAATLAVAYTDAINDPAPEALERFRARMTPTFRDSVPAPVLADFFDDQRRVSGGKVDVLGARVTGGAKPILEIALRNRVYGGVQGAVLTLDDAHQQFTNLALTPAPTWASQPAARQTPRHLGARVVELTQRGCAAGVFSGAVLIATEAGVLAEHACGEASRRYHVRNTPGTRFNLGSMDKMFTAVAAMQLAERGKLDLDATLDRYLDAGWLDPAVARRVTVWQLMTHTSGLEPDFLSAMKDRPRTTFRDLADYRALTVQARTTFEPGSKFEYSNTGMLLLGGVVAAASGEDYFAYVKRHIFEPAGMTGAGAFAADDPEADLATGYYRVAGAPYGWRENTFKSPLRGGPAGGGYATTRDLFRFFEALHDGKLVSPEGLAKLWTVAADGDYGAGFEITRGAVGSAVGHSGILGGVSTRARLYRERGYLVVVLSNIDRGAPPLVDAIEGEILRTDAR